MALSLIIPTVSLFTQQSSAQNLPELQIETSSSGQRLGSNPVLWKTRYAKLASNDFYIRIGDKTFYGADMQRVSSDPGTERSTLELTWQEHGVEMRMNLYFRLTNAQTWEIYDVRTYNAQVRGDWIYYAAETPVTGPKGSTSSQATRVFRPTDGSDAEVYCGDCRIDAFMTQPLAYSSYGYGLELMLGLSENETITVSTDPMSGYGVNALLRNTKNEVITDQTGISYEWNVADPSIAQVSANSIEYADGGGCAYGMKSPCPSMNGQISGKNPGVTKIQVSARRDGYTIALAEFDVKVVAMAPRPWSSGSPYPTTQPSSLPTPSGSPFPKPSLSPWPLPVDDGSLTEEQLRREVENLQKTVGVMQLDVAKQRKDLNVLQRMVQSMQNFFSRVLRRN